MYGNKEFIAKINLQGEVIDVTKNEKVGHDNQVFNELKTDYEKLDSIATGYRNELHDIWEYLKQHKDIFIAMQNLGFKVRIKPPTVEQVVEESNQKNEMLMSMIRDMQLQIKELTEKQNGGISVI